MTALASRDDVYMQLVIYNVNNYYRIFFKIKLLPSCIVHASLHRSASICKDGTSGSEVLRAVCLSFSHVFECWGKDFIKTYCALRSTQLKIGTRKSEKPKKIKDAQCNTDHIKCWSVYKYKPQTENASSCGSVSFYLSNIQSWYWPMQVQWK